MAPGVDLPAGGQLGGAGSLDLVSEQHVPLRG